MKPINIKDQLPSVKQRCLWWHSLHKRWYIGIWYLFEGKYSPGAFVGAPNGYVFDGIATHWMPEPDAPEGKQ